MTPEENTWEEVSPDTHDMWDFRTKKTIQGVYVAKKENVGENDSNIYVLNVGDEKVGVWGSAVLDGRFEQIAIGSEVKIEYLGKKTGEKGGREYHNFIVYRRPAPFQEVGDTPDDDEDNIPVIETEENEQETE